MEAADAVESGSAWEKPSWMITRAQEEQYYGTHEKEERPQSEEYRDTVIHTWDGEDTLFPTAIGPFDLMDRNVTDGQGILIGNYPMRYVDLTDGTETIPCGIPGCAHEDASCEAFGAPLCFPGAGKLYRIQNVQGGDRYQLMLSVRPLSGGEERELGVIEGRIDAYIRCNVFLLYYGDNAYLLTKRREDFRYGMTDLSEHIADLYLTTLNLRDDTFTQEELPGPMPESLAKKGKTEAAARVNGSVWYLGAMNGQIYLLSRGTKEDGVDEPATIAYYRYDTETGELTYRDDGYPDEFPGPIRVNRQSVLSHVLCYPTIEKEYDLKPLMPLLLYKDKLFYEDEAGIVRYELTSGEEELIVEASENSGLYARLLYANFTNDDLVNQPWSGLYYQRDMQDETMMRCDLETGESVPFSLKDGKKIRTVLAEGNGVLYAELDTDRPITAKIDVSQGYANCPWEEVE